MSGEPAGGAGILARYARVLEAVAAAPEGLSLTETARATGLPRGTVHRLIGALLEVGYLAARDGRKVYVLGPRLVHLLHLGAGTAPVAALVRPALEGLAARFGETAFLARLRGERVEALAMVAPSGAAGRAHVRPGRVLPLHAAASAKAIFAFQDEERVARALARPRLGYTAATRVEEGEVRAELERVRRTGYARCANELDPGVLSYAVPVRLPGGAVFYSVGLVGLDQRLAARDPAEVVAALGEAAATIAERLAEDLPRAVEAPARAEGQR